MSTLLLTIAAICAVILFFIIRRKKKQEHLVKRVRASDLYGHLYPLLLRCNRRCVESIALKTDSVCIRLYKPAGRTLLYTFEKHGFDPLNEEYLYALAQAVAVDLPLLRDHTRYTFHTRTEIRFNGHKADWYEYMITTDYKDSMIRAEYLEKAPHRA
ncbi:MAG: hypothetical protein E7316_01480 [Clostridiales bacterium]|nr:hypothetical protein [Clostridiales bacterium]